MKKTLLVTIDFPPAVGGVATYWKQIAKSSSKEELVILTLPASTSFDDSISPNVIRKKMFYRFIWPRWIRGIFTIYSTYKKHKCDQIIVGQLLPVGNMVWVLSKLFSIPYLVQIYGMDILQAGQHRRKKRLAKVILTNAKKVLVNTQFVGNLVNKAVGQELEITVIYPIPESMPETNEELRKQLIQNHRLNAKRIILTIGRLVPRKGQDKTLGAMLHIWQNYQDAIYVIVGGGPDLARLKTMAAPHQDKVIFTGRVSDQVRNAWLSLADIFVMPSRQTDEDVEGFGIVYLEAGSFGIPVIAGRAGGAVEAVLDEKTGLLVDPEDIDKIAGAILRLLDDDKLAENLGLHAKQRLKTDISWHKSMEEFRKALN